MYKKTKIFEVCWSGRTAVGIPGLSHKQFRALFHKHGSKRSGTVYIVADDPDEAVEVFCGFMKQVENMDIPENLLQAAETHLVRNPLIGPRL